MKAQPCATVNTAAAYPSICLVQSPTDSNAGAPANAALSLLPILHAVCCQYCTISTQPKMNTSIYRQTSQKKGNARRVFDKVQIKGYTDKVKRKRQKQAKVKRQKESDGYLIPQRPRERRSTSPNLDHTTSHSYSAPRATAV